MKIGLISSEFPPEAGGVQTYAWEFAHELARRGHGVTVFTQPHAGGEARSDAIVIRPALRLRRRHDRALFAREKMDVWHALNSAYAWLALETAPVFVSVHGNDFLNPYVPVARLDLRTRLHLPLGSKLDRWIGDRLTARLLHRSLPRAAHIFANSRYTEQLFCARNPACRGRTSAALLGVSESFFTRPKPLRRDGPPRLVTVCRLVERHKNVDLVLRALARLAPDFPFHYTVIGEGELRAEYEALTATLGLGERVTFTGRAPHEELHRHLLDSDLFILPTTATPLAYEGFGIVYLEAAACGCPVIAARIGGAVEAVEENVTGLLVDTVTPETLAANIRRVLSGEARFSPERCVAFARRFSWARMTDHCLAHYARHLPPAR